MLSVTAYSAQQWCQVILQKKLKIGNLTKKQAQNAFGRKIEQNKSQQEN